MWKLLWLVSFRLQNHPFVRGLPPEHPKSMRACPNCKTCRKVTLPFQRFFFFEAPHEGKRCIPAMTTQASFSSILSYFKDFICCLNHCIMCYWPNIKRQGHCLDQPAALFLCLPGSVCLTWLSWAPSASSLPPGKELCLLALYTFPCSGWQDMAGMY